MVKMVKVGGTFFRSPAEEGWEMDVWPRIGGESFLVDVLVGTPMKILEMAKGHSWNCGLDVCHVSNAKCNVHKHASTPHTHCPPV
jgi:hypothetical protein